MTDGGFAAAQAGAVFPVACKKDGRIPPPYPVERLMGLFRAAGLSCSPFFMEVPHMSQILVEHLSFTYPGSYDPVF